MDENSLSGVAAVVGAGTMGGGIAADLANAGWTVHLLDVTEAAAAAGWERVRDARPPLLFLPEFASRIRPAALASAPDALRAADWVVEAVAEALDVKRSVLASIEAHIRPDAIVTSNTSGLGLAAMSAHCSPAFRRRFFGTHFLNPPRYLKLLEVIPTPESDPQRTAAFVRFAEQILGHRVVLAKDTPGFISTRLWITHLLDTMHTAAERGIGVDRVDALTGPLIGRPRSATFRMADLVGLDIVAAIAANQHAALPRDPLRKRLLLPNALRDLRDSGRTGEKAGAGFYRRDVGEILVLDRESLDYRPRREVLPDALASLVRLPLAVRLAALASLRGSPEADFLSTILNRLIAYAEQIGPEIAADVLAIDRTMQWGFGWELGPFAMADCRDGRRANHAPSYTRGTAARRAYRAFQPPTPRPWPDEPEYIDLAVRKAAGNTLTENDAASLVDIGDGVFCVEFHTKMNTLRPETCELLLLAVERAAREGCGLVIGNQGPHFSAGYDLSRLVGYRERGDLAAIDAEMRTCQDTFQTIKYAPIPVVAAPHGFTLGGGCECALHCHAIQAATELQIGLPEAAAGVIPCGGGHKETLLRALERLGPDADPLEAARIALRAIALAGYSANAYDALRESWLARSTDAISHNADRRLFDAKQRALALASGGWKPPEPARIPVTGTAGLDPLREEIAALQATGRLTGYDAVIADHIAAVLSGAGGPPRLATEWEMLEQERATFVSLCREPRTLARMRHLLETGKRLRE